jgi:phosphoserine phosphatase RsbU/P
VTGEQPPDLNLAFLLGASRRLNRTLELEHLLEEIRSVCLEAVDAEAVSVLIWDEERGRLEFQLAFNRSDEAARRLYLHPGEGLAGWISENDQPVIVNDLQYDPRYQDDIDRALGFQGRSVLGIPIHRGRGVVGVVEIVNARSPEGFAERDLATMLALADPLAIAIDNALLYRNLEREKAENEILYRVGLKLSQTLDLDTTLSLILDLIHQVLPYDAAGIFLIEGDRLEGVNHRGYPPGTEESLRLKIGQGAIGWVVKTGEPLRIPDVSRDRRYFISRPETRSELAVPLISEEKTIGAFNLENDRLDAYRPRDVRLLMSMANQAAISVQRAQLYRELLRRQRLHDEVEIARRIQQSFLPASEPELPGFAVSGTTVPSLEVGGDSYDTIRINKDHLGIMVADVAGKGIPAALILATFGAAMRSEVRSQYAIRRILRNVNTLLIETTEPGRFVTGVYGVLDMAQSIFTYSNAGHNLPLLLRRDGRLETLNAGGPILGVFPEAVYEEGRIDLAEGDVIFFYTDGASEGKNPAGEEFGVERLEDLLKRHAGRSAGEIRLAIQEEILRHCDGKAEDDVTLVVLKVGEAARDQAGG